MNWKNTITGISMIAIFFATCSCEKEPTGPPDDKTPPDSSTIDSITYPILGTKVLMADTIDITWSGDASNVKIEFSMDGNSFSSLTPLAISQGTAKIIIPEIDVATTNSIKITNAGNTSDTVVVTSSAFTTLGLLLTNPVGGETYSLGAKVTITWKANANFVAGVLVNVSYDNGRTWELLNTSGQAPVNGNFEWTVPTGISATTDARIQITDYLTFTVKDRSNKFTLQ